MASAVMSAVRRAALRSMTLLSENGAEFVSASAINNIGAPAGSECSFTRPQCIAHRGGACDGPENTMGALRQALEMGADGVEFDLQRTKDGYLIILHDDTLERTAAPFSAAVADSTGLSAAEYAEVLTTNVNDLTLAQIQAIDVGSFYDAVWGGERVPVFEDALRLIAKFPGRKLYAEIKRGDYKSADLCAAVVDRLSPDPEQLWFIGFNFDVMKYTKKLLPNYPTLHVMDPRIPVLNIDVEAFVDLAMESARVLDGIDPCALPTSVSQRVIEAVRSLDDHPDTRRKKTVACWVWKKFPETDMPDNWAHLVRVGVDAITTDKPREMLQFLDCLGGDGGGPTQATSGMEAVVPATNYAPVAPPASSQAANAGPVPPLLRRGRSATLAAPLVVPAAPVPDDIAGLGWLDLMHKKVQRHQRDVTIGSFAMLCAQVYRPISSDFMPMSRVAVGTAR